MSLLDQIAFAMPEFTEPCSCGGTIFIGTDGNGHAIEDCDQCHAHVVTPRAAASLHPLFIAFDREIAEMRATIETERAHMPLCLCGCGQHVAGHRSQFAPSCAQFRRRKHNRERMHEQYELKKAQRSA